MTCIKIYQCILTIIVVSFDFEMLCSFKAVLVTTVVHLHIITTLTWHSAPLCGASPTSSDYQYYIPGNNGDYKYGYRADNGAIVAQQEADSTNQVAGHYFYRTDLGNFGLKYTAGIGGYRPELVAPSNGLVYQQYHPPNTKYTKAYDFSFDTDKYRKKESSDSNGDIKGHFEYEDNSGHHDLSYVANDKEGFKVTGGNLATSNIRPRLAGYFSDTSGQISLGTNFKTPYFKHQSSISPYYETYWPLQSTVLQNNEGLDRTYHYSFDAGNYKKEEWSDKDGNVKGYFEYVDEAGPHDLSNIANDKAGFQITGGNLATSYPKYLPEDTKRNDDEVDQSTNQPESNDEIVFLIGQTTMKPE